MRRTALLGAVLVALLSAGAAHAQSGYVGLSYQNTDFGGGDVDATGLSGAVLLGEHVQLNARYAHLEAGGDADYWGVDAFLFNRMEGGGFGGFVGYDTIDGEDVDEWAIGGFGQLYAGNTTWTGQLGYADTEGDVQVIHLDGEARHFLNENFSLQGNLGYGQIDADGPSGTDDYWSAGVGAEFQFAAAPVSIFGGWQHLDAGGNEADRLGIGARWHFGGGSLFDRDRSGASLQRVTPTIIELELGGGVTPR